MHFPIVPVHGTYGGFSRDDASDWVMPGSPQLRNLQDRGYSVVCPEDPFMWSGGLNWRPGSHEDWKAAGWALNKYVSPSHVDSGNTRIQSHDIILWMHSHAWQVGLYACAPRPMGMGLRVRGAVTFGSPIRQDMASVAQAAMSNGNIPWWIHITSDWSDWIQFFGSWFDRAWGVERRAIYRDGTRVLAKGHTLSIPGVGHSKLVRQPWDYPEETLTIDSLVAAFATGKMGDQPWA